MKVVNTIIASALISGVVMTSANAMGRKGDPEFNHFIMKMSDTNGDGKVSKEEFMKMSAKMAAKEFMMMDMNDDGQLESEEFISGMR